jgi:hypothetical protein
MTVTVAGNATGSKPINLTQLEAELVTAGLTVSGLGMQDDQVYTYDASGAPSDFPSASQSTVDQAIADHVAMRAKTDEEYATEFQDESTTPERKQELRDISAGLLPHEQVQITQTEWDAR